MSRYDAMLRRKLLDEIYNKMSQEEKLMFAQMTMQNKSANEIMAKLDIIDKKIHAGPKAFASDFAANVLGNYFADATIHLGSKLLKAIK